MQLKTTRNTKQSEVNEQGKIVTVNIWFKIRTSPIVDGINDNSERKTLKLITRSCHKHKLKECFHL